MPATNLLQLNVSFKKQGESKNSSHRWKAENSKDAVSVILYQHKKQDKSSKFPVSAFALRSCLFWSPPINIALVTWGYGSKNTTKHFDILKADLGNSKCYLTMFSEIHDTSWSYFLTKGVASDNPERGKCSLLLKGADVTYCCPFCLLPISHSNCRGLLLTYQDVSVAVFQATKQHWTVWEYQTRKGLEAPS